MIWDLISQNGQLCTKRSAILQKGPQFGTSVAQMVNYLKKVHDLGPPPPKRPAIFLKGP